MQTYSIHQWFMFFYFYSFLGWIWESCYVSLRQKKWVNRGFMHGPMLPIYGSGAIVILAATLPFSQNIYLIFIVGMFAATVLEYYTGAAMEALFHMRYWNYSNQKLNLKGYICLSSSLTWGGFSILMDRVIHPPVADLLLNIPDHIAEPLTYCITIAATADFMQSLHEALDLRELLDKITSNNAEFTKIQTRLEELENTLTQNIQEHKEQAAERHVIMQGHRKTISDLINHYLERLNKIPNISNEKRISMQNELLELKEHASRLIPLSALRSNRRIRSSLHILHRNPTSISKKYAAALSELRRFDSNKKNN